VGALTQSGHENKAYDITGPELLSFPKAVAMASALAGKPIQYIPVSDDATSSPITSNCSLAVHRARCWMY
jgi:uncharacterized protein YbjT (DUF2867 family)